MPTAEQPSQGRNLDRRNLDRRNLDRRNLERRIPFVVGCGLREYVV